MKIAIYGKSFSESFTDSFRLMCNMFAEKEVDVVIYRPFYDFIVQEMNYQPLVQGYFTEHNDFPTDVDYLFTIGGDGTFLGAVAIVRNLGIPLVGINCGRLGFMADISQDKIPQAVIDIFQGDFTIEERNLLKVESVGEDLFSDFNCAMNEFAVHKKNSASMITIHTYLNNEYLNSYWADGLIIATPTGSTGYSLSVGGPILIPNTQNFVISPISPHNLSVRPIVVPNNSGITIRVEGRSDNFLASLDSRVTTFNAATEIKVSKGDYKINVLKLKNYSFYETLRNKLMWGADKRN